MHPRLNVSLQGSERDVGQNLISAAHETRPHFKATSGNIDVAIAVVCSDCQFSDCFEEIRIWIH
jgi:organic hydroperoxide reductase OsmC/OhrA